jgi:hypothetical protein
MIGAAVVPSPMPPMASSSIHAGPTLAPWVTTSPTHSLATSQPIVSRHSRAPSWCGAAQGAKMTIDELCRRELPSLRFRVLEALADRPLVNPPGVRTATRRFSRARQPA